VVRAFKQGMAPLVIGILLATGVILATSQGTSPDHWPLWLLTTVTALLVWRTRIHLLWLLGAGAVLGGLGWV
jgi:chromate transporter